MALPTASFTFEIGGVAGSSASAEIDTRDATDGGDNARRLGKTSNFQPGDEIGFLVFYDHDKYTVDYINTSIMEITGASVNIGTERNNTALVKQTETITFSQRGESKELSKKVVSGTFTAKNVGNNPQSHYQDGEAILKDDFLTFAMAEVKDSDKIKDSDTDAQKTAKLKLQRKPTVYQCEYKTKARLCKLQTPSRDTIIADTANFSSAAPWAIHVSIYLKEK